MNYNNRHLVCRNKVTMIPRLYMNGSDFNHMHEQAALRGIDRSRIED